jgi:hypothetical protein
MKYLAALILLAATLSLGACDGLYGDDEFARYMQRSDKITLSAGDAKEVNAATQTIHPWPRGVGDPRISANGERMERAIDRYRRGPGTESGRSQAVGAAVGAPVTAPAAATSQTTSTTATNGANTATQSETTTMPTPPAGPGSY